jgi:hypothetical protein
MVQFVADPCNQWTPQLLRYSIIIFIASTILLSSWKALRTYSTTCASLRMVKVIPLVGWVCGCFTTFNNFRFTSHMMQYVQAPLDRCPFVNSKLVYRAIVQSSSSLYAYADFDPSLTFLADKFATFLVWSAHMTRLPIIVS